MERQLLLNLKLDTSTAEQELNRFKSQHTGVELIDEAKTSKAIKSLSNQLKGLKENLAINTELDTKNVDKQVKTLKTKLEKELGEEIKVKIGGDFAIDTDAIKEAISSSFDISGSMAHFNLIEDSLKELGNSLNNLTGAIELDLASVDEAHTQIDSLQEKLVSLSANIGIDLNTPSNNDNNKQVFAATPKNSDQVLKVEQDAVSTPRTKLSKNYIENVNKDTRNASRNVSRAKQGTLERYLKELTSHKKNIENSGSDAGIDKLLGKLETTINKVSKRLEANGTSLSSLKKQNDNELNQKNSNSFKGLFDTGKLEQNREKAYKPKLANTDAHQEMSVFLKYFGRAVGDVMQQFSTLPATTPLVERNAQIKPTAHANANMNTGDVSLSPLVAKKLFESQKSDSVSFDSLKALVHELRHTQQLAIKAANGGQIPSGKLMTQAQTPHEQKILESVDRGYKGKSSEVMELEYDAHLFAERVTGQIATALGYKLDADTLLNPLSKVEERIASIISSMRESYEELESNPGMPKDRQKILTSNIGQQSAYLKEKVGVARERLDYVASKGGDQPGSNLHKDYTKLEQLLAQLPDALDIKTNRDILKYRSSDFDLDNQGAYLQKHTRDTEELASLKGFKDFMTKPRHLVKSQEQKDKEYQDYVGNRKVGNPAAHTKMAEYIQAFGDTVGLVMAELSELPATTPLVTRDSLMAPNTDGTANKKTGNVALSPLVSQKLMGAKPGESIDLSALNTLVHELRHSQQLAAMKANGGKLPEDKLMLTAENEAEQKILDTVDRDYEGVSELDKKLEYDAHLFAHRMSETISGILGYQFTEETSSVEDFSDKVNAILSSMRESFTELELNPDMPKQRKEDLQANIGQQASGLEEYRGLAEKLVLHYSQTAEKLEKSGYGDSDQAQKLKDLAAQYEDLLLEIPDLGPIKTAGDLERFEADDFVGFDDKTFLASKGSRTGKDEPVGYTADDLLKVLQKTEQLNPSDNYQPIYNARETAIQDLPGLSREDFDKLLYELQARDELDISTLEETNDYSAEQITSGIEQPVGGRLFFLTLNDLEKVTVGPSNQDLTTSDESSLTEHEPETEGTQPPAPPNEPPVPPAAAAAPEPEDEPSNSEAFDEAAAEMAAAADAMADFGNAFEADDFDIAELIADSAQEPSEPALSDEQRENMQNASHDLLQNQMAREESQRFEAEIARQEQAQRDAEDSYFANDDEALEEDDMYSEESYAREAERLAARRIEAEEHRARQAEEAAIQEAADAEAAEQARAAQQAAMEEALRAQQEAAANAYQEPELEQALTDDEQAEMANRSQDLLAEQMAREARQREERNQERQEEEERVSRRMAELEEAIEEEAEVRRRRDEGIAETERLAPVVQAERDHQISEEIDAAERDNSYYSSDDERQVLGLDNRDAIQNIFDGLSEMDNLAGRVFKSFSDIFKLLAEFTVPGGFIALTNLFTGLVVSSIDTMVAFQQLQLTIDGLDVGNSADAINTVKELSTEFGLSIESTAQALAGFSAATQGTSLESESNRIFASVSKYGAAIGADSEKMGRAFTALEQIAAKGKVSLEELNGQLAEALSGASNIAANSLGITRREMFEMAEAGDLLATDLLPKMASAMELLSEQSGILGEQTLKQEWGKLTAQIDIAKLNATGGVLDALTQSLGWLNQTIKDNPGLMQAVEFGMVSVGVAATVLGVKTLKASLAIIGFNSSLAKSLWIGAKFTLLIAAISAALYGIKVIADKNPLGGFYDGIGDKSKKHLADLKKIGKEMRTNLDLYKEQLSLENDKDNRDKQPGDVFTPEQKRKRLQELEEGGFGSLFAGITSALGQTGHDLAQGNLDNPGLESHRDKIIENMNVAAPVEVSIKALNSFGEALMKGTKALGDFGVNLQRDPSEVLADEEQAQREQNKQFVDEAKAAANTAREFINSGGIQKLSQHNDEARAVTEEVNRGNSFEAFLRNSLQDYTGDSQLEYITTEIADSIREAAVTDDEKQLANNLSQVRDVDSAYDLIQGHRDSKQIEANDLEQDAVKKQLPAVLAAIETLKSRLNEGGLDNQTRTTLEKELTYMEQAAADMKAAGQSYADATKNLSVALEKDRLSRERTLEGRDSLDTQANTFIKQQAIRNGITNQDAIQAASDKNALQRLNKERNEPRERVAQADARIKQLSKSDRSTIGILANLGQQLTGGNTQLTDADKEKLAAQGKTAALNSKEDKSQIDLSGLTVEVIEDILAAGDELKSTVKDALNERLEALKAEREEHDRINSEVTDIHFSALERSKEAAEKKQDIAEQEDENTKDHADKMAALDERRAEQLEGFAERLKDLNGNLKDAAKNLNDTFVDLVDSLNDEIRGIVAETKKLELENAFKEISLELKKATEGFDASDIGQSLLETISKLRDLELGRATNDIDNEQEELNIEDRFQDGVDSIQSAFDSYLESFRTFQDGMAQLAEDQRKAAEEAAKSRADAQEQAAQKAADIAKRKKEAEEFNLGTKLLGNVNVHDTDNAHQDSFDNARGVGRLSPASEEYNEQFGQGSAQAQFDKISEHGEKTVEANQAINEALEHQGGISAETLEQTKTQNGSLKELVKYSSQKASGNLAETNKILYEIYNGLGNIYDKLCETAVTGGDTKMSEYTLEQQKESDSSVQDARYAATLVAQVNDQRSQAASLYNEAYGNRNGAVSHEAIEKFGAANLSLTESNEQLKKEIARLNANGIKHDLKALDLSQINKLNENQHHIPSESGYMISDDRYTDKRSDLEKVAFGKRQDFLMQADNYKGSEWIKHADESELIKLAKDKRLDYSAPVKEVQQQFQTNSERLQGLNPYEITDTVSEAAMSLQTSLEKAAEVKETEQSQTPDTIILEEGAIELVTPTGEDMAESAQTPDVITETEQAHLDGVDHLADPAREANQTRKDEETNNLNQKKVGQNIDYETTKFDILSDADKKFRDFTENQRKEAEELQKIKLDNFNPDAIDRVFRSISKADEDLQKSLREKLAQLEKEQESLEQNYLEARDLATEGMAEGSAEAQAAVLEVLAKYSPLLEQGSANVGAAKTLSENQDAKVSSNQAVNKLSARNQIEAERKYDNKVDFLDAKLDRKGASGFFANNQERERFKANQDVAREGRIRDRSARIQELSPVELDPTELRSKAEADVAKLEEIELGNFRAKMDNLVNASKDISKDAFRDLLSLDFIGSDESIGDQLISVALGALQKLQDWAASYVTDSIFDLLFNGEKTEGEDIEEVNSHLKATAEQTAATKIETDKLVTEATIESETESAKSIADNRASLADSAGLLAAGGAAAVGGAIAGSGTAVGSGIGSILGTVVGSFFGQPQLGAAAGGVLGGAVGGLFYNGTDEVSKSYLEMPIAEAMRVEEARSGRSAQLSVLHEGEAVLSTLNGDADTFRRLKASGSWELLKGQSYAYGADYVGHGANNYATSFNNPNYNNAKTSNHEVVNNFNITATDSSVIRRTTEALNAKRARLGL